MSYNVHDEYQSLSVERIQEIYREMALPFSVACLNVSKDLNVGMILRTAAFFGAQKGYVLGRRKYDKRTTVGAQHYMPVDRIDCIKGNVIDCGMAINALGDHTIISVEQDNGKDHFMDIRDFPFHTVRNPCLVFGNETSDGIPDDFLRLSDYRVYIPDHGVTRSLNVSNAASIAIHEAYRRFI